LPNPEPEKWQLRTSLKMTRMKAGEMQEPFWIDFKYYKFFGLLYY